VGIVARAKQKNAKSQKTFYYLGAYTQEYYYLKQKTVFSYSCP